jgi:hypothetical protein
MNSDENHRQSLDLPDILRKSATKWYSNLCQFSRRSRKSAPFAIKVVKRRCNGLVGIEVVSLRFRHRAPESDRRTKRMRGGFEFRRTSWFGDLNRFPIMLFTLSLEPEHKRHIKTYRFGSNLRVTFCSFFLKQIRSAFQCEPYHLRFPLGNMNVFSLIVHINGTVSRFAQITVSKRQQFLYLSATNQTFKERPRR